MGSTFVDYKGLSPDVQAHLIALEDFIGDVDGKETVLWHTGRETCVDDGTIDAEDAVKAFNGLVAALTAAAAARPAQRASSEEVAEFLERTAGFSLSTAQDATGYRDAVDNIIRAETGCGYAEAAKATAAIVALARPCRSVGQRKAIASD